MNLSALGAGAWLSWPSIMIKPLKDGDFGYKATDSEISTMVALYDMGNMITPIPTAYLTDIIGRKPAILITVPFLIVATFCALIATNVWYLYVGRLLAGMAKGIAFSVVPLFQAEIAHVSIRGSLGSIPSSMIGIGVFLTYMLGMVLPPYYINYVYILFPVALATIWFFIPETPYFLVMKGKESQAENSLKIYRQYKSNDKRLNDEMQTVIKTVEEDKDKKARFIDVAATKSRRRALLLVCLTTIFQRTAGMGPLLAYNSVILPDSGGGASKEAYAVMLSLVSLVANNIGLVLVEICGRKGLLILSTVFCTIMTAVFAVFYHVRHSGQDVSAYNWIPFACLLIFGLFWSMGLCIVPTVYVGELFPMNVKSYASSLATIMYGGSNFVVNKMFGDIYPTYGVEVMFYFFTLSSCVYILFIIFFAIETKGKTFLEIQRKLNNITGTRTN